MSANKCLAGNKIKTIIWLLRHLSKLQTIIGVYIMFSVASACQATCSGTTCAETWTNATDRGRCAGTERARTCPAPMRATATRASSLARITTALVSCFYQRHIDVAFPSEYHSIFSFIKKHLPPSLYHRNLDVLHLALKRHDVFRLRPNPIDTAS